MDYKNNVTNTDNRKITTSAPCNIPALKEASSNNAKLLLIHRWVKFDLQIILPQNVGLMSV